MLSPEGWVRFGWGRGERSGRKFKVEGTACGGERTPLQETKEVLSSWNGVFEEGYQGSWGQNRKMAGIVIQVGEQWYSHSLNRVWVQLCFILLNCFARKQFIPLPSRYTSAHLTISLLALGFIIFKSLPISARKKLVSHCIDENKWVFLLLGKGVNNFSRCALTTQMSSLACEY